MRPTLLPLALAVVAGCANDPMYLPAPMPVEAGVADMMGMLSVGKASLQLPIKTETAADAKTRAALAAKLAPIMVPYVKIGDVEVELEWTIKNLDAKPGQAKIQLNGANELFAFDPTLLNLAPDDPEAPKTPGLAGDVPIDVPGSGEVSGLFTEDELREAAIDLDQITRGNVNPFRAVLTVSKNAASFQPMTPPMPTVMNYVPTPVGPPVPRAAFAAMTRIDLVFKPTTHMTLAWNVRVRDLRGIVHPLGLAAVTQKPGELQTFMPMMYNPTPAPKPPAPPAG
jgi:hypothetical protein